MCIGLDTRLGAYTWNYLFYTCLLFFFFSSSPLHFAWNALWFLWSLLLKHLACIKKVWQQIWEVHIINFIFQKGKQSVCTQSLWLRAGHETRNQMPPSCAPVLSKTTPSCRHHSLLIYKTLDDIASSFFAEKESESPYLIMGISCLNRIKYQDN